MITTLAKTVPIYICILIYINYPYYIYIHLLHNILFEHIRKYTKYHGYTLVHIQKSVLYTKCSILV